MPKSSKFQNLEDSLYDPTDAPVRTRVNPLHSESSSVSKEWTTEHDHDTKNTDQDTQEQELSSLKKKGSFLRKFFISSVLFFLVALGFGVYSFFIKNKINPEGNIAIGIVGSTFTQAGEELQLTIEIENRNDFALEVVDLIIEYPREGEKPTASLETTTRERMPLGIIQPREHVLKEIPFVLYGKEGDKKEIHFTLEYNIANSSTIFQKQKIYAVTLSSSPITMRIIGAPVAVPDQRYKFIVEVSTNTKKPLDNILLALNYPVGFIYESATVEPAVEKNIWDVGTLIPGAPKQIEITGQFAGTDGDERSIRALFGTYLNEDKTKISTNLGTLLQTVTLEKPFLSTDLSINSSSDEFVNIQPGEQIRGEIFWKNNLPNQVLDLEIKLQLKGTFLDRARIEVPDGFYNSQNDSIIWNKNTIDQFVRVPSGAGGTLHFTIPTIPPMQDGTIKNPQFDFEVYVKALEDSEGSVPKIIESVEHTTVRIGGNISFSHTVRYHTGPITNTGPYPPRVNEPTTYTVELNIANTFNDYTQGEVRAKFPPNVTYSNIFVPVNEKVRYEEKTGELVWQVGSIKQSQTPRVLSIQLTVIPSLSQVGEFVPLLKTLTFSAIDAFTKKTVTQSIDVITGETDRNSEEDSSIGVVIK